MPSLKDLKNRIQSVKNTQQITKTMKMVAAAKVRKARTRCEESRPYGEKLNSVLVGLAQNVGESQSAPLLLRGRDEVKTVRIMVFGSDRGLCGGFNTNLIKRAVSTIKENLKAGKTVQIVTLGRKTKDLLKSEFGSMIIESYDDISKELTYAKAQEIGVKMVTEFEKGDCDQIVMLYNRFVSMMTQDPILQQLAPFKPDVNGDKELASPASIEYEPEEEVILAQLLPRNVSVQILLALLESNASEQAARMTAMDNSTRNAGDMINRLSLEYNRSRQAAITSELIEIISGAEAV